MTDLSFKEESEDGGGGIGGAGGDGEETVVPLEVAVAIGDKMFTMLWRWVEQLLEIGW